MSADEVPVAEGQHPAPVALDRNDPLPFPEFELHYDFASVGVAGILENLLQDLSSHRPLHNWDLDCASDPLAHLMSFARRELDSSQFGSGSYMVNFSAVDEVVTMRGAINKASAHTDPGDMRRQFFHVKESVVTPKAVAAGSNTATPRLNYGRVIRTNEHIPDGQRATLLLLHAFCLRLQNEDSAFVRNFIHRHLCFKPSFKMPYYLQDVSPSDTPTKCYKRVSLSLHLPHLLLQHEEGPIQTPAIQTIDREYLGQFGPDEASSVDGHQGHLYRATSSVLLTIVLPEEQELCEEAVDLLSTPDALWTVLLVNAAPHSLRRVDQEPLEFWTPVGQFLRGVCGAVELQRINIDPILEELKKQLREHIDYQRSDGLEKSHLFDDKSFIKSKLYHWIIKTCHEICSSIDITLRFVGSFEDVHLRALREKAHPYERLGLAYWVLRLGEEKTKLDMLQAEVHAFREQVRELRDALHGATAVLESRIAARQGDQIRILTYVSLAYMPVSTVSSLYSMQVLPNQATFGSFCAVTIVALLLTLLLAICLQDIITMMFRSPKMALDLVRLVIKYPYLERLRVFDHDLYIRYREALDRYEARLADFNDEHSSSLFLVLLISPQRELIYVLRLFQRPEETYNYTVKFSSTKLIIDILRVFILLLRICLQILLVALLVVVIILVLVLGIVPFLLYRAFKTGR